MTPGLGLIAAKLAAALSSRGGFCPWVRDGNRGGQAVIELTPVGTLYTDQLGRGEYRVAFGARSIKTNDTRLVADVNRLLDEAGVKRGRPRGRMGVLFERRGFEQRGDEGIGAAGTARRLAEEAVARRK